MSSESLHTKCKKCGRSVFKSETKCPQCGKSLGLTRRISLVWIAVGVLVLLAFIGGMFGDKSPSRATVAPQPKNQVQAADPPLEHQVQYAEPPLELQSWRCGTEHGYIHVRGEVKNVSTRKLENVMVVGMFYTKSGDFVKSESALIDYNPILPGQSSPFESMGTGNPAITNCKISFKSLFGGSIAYSTK
tara:strand:- start:39 stop:605 length:567 start_codon:yes stop_codon:yes gene_type:complete